MSDETDFPSLCGKFLIAMPGMGDSRFERTVIYICAHSTEGAMGFIINRTMDNPNVPDFLEQLEIITSEERIDFENTLAAMGMYVGGPVEPGRGFVLHTEEFNSTATISVRDEVYLTATLEILRSIATGKGPKKALIALGYAGWAAGQLEDEITSNGWLTVDADKSIIFDCDISKRYSQSLALLGVDESLLSSNAGHA
ncbi:MAG: YqgE/AlgH family protein [Pseudomonadota bacterium]